MTWRRLLNELYSRILAWVQTSSPGTVQVTGVLGLALLVAGYYHIRGGGPDDERGQQRPPGAGGSAGGHVGTSSAPLPHPANHSPSAAGPSSARRPSTAAAAGGAAAARADASAASAAVRPAASALSRTVHDKLVGVRRITLSVPGVLLHQWRAEELQDAATVRPDAAALLCEAARVSSLYLVAHVQDDIGQAAVSGALESAGLVGPKPGQVPAHRLLFCSTLEGKVSIVRQLEPELHIDGHSATVEELRRFMPQLVHVYQPGSAPAAPQGAPNVGHATSLAAFFGV